METCPSRILVNSNAFIDEKPWRERILLWIYMMCLVLIWTFSVGFHPQWAQHRQEKKSSFLKPTCTTLKIQALNSNEKNCHVWKWCKDTKVLAWVQDNHRLYVKHKSPIKSHKALFIEIQRAQKAWWWCSSKNSVNAGSRMYTNHIHLTFWLRFF